MRCVRSDPDPHSYADPDITEPVKGKCSYKFADKLAYFNLKTNYCMHFDVPLLGLDVVPVIVRAQLLWTWSRSRLWLQLQRNRVAPAPQHCCQYLDFNFHSSVFILVLLECVVGGHQS